MKYAELSEENKERVRDKRRDWNVQDQWWDAVYADAIECAKLLGITTKAEAISFSGFCSQGDGACFTGGYSFKPAAVEKIKEHAPQDEELLRIAEQLTVLQLGWKMKHNEHLSANISRSGGNYTHSGTMQIEVTTSDNDTTTAQWLVVDGPTAEALTRLMRDFADWIYRQLEQECNYLESDECLDEQFADEDFDVDEDGVVLL